MMFEPAPWYLSSAWLLPALLLGLGVLVITALSWPIGWAARRRYGAKLAFAGHDLKAYRLVRGFSALVVLVLIGWAVAIGRSEEHTSELQSLMRISSAVFCLKKKKSPTQETQTHHKTNKKQTHR